MKLSEFTQHRLAFFVTDGRTNAPLRKIPIYAEIMVSRATSRQPLRLECGRYIELGNRNPALAAEVEKQLAEVVTQQWLDSNDCQLVSALSERVEEYVERAVTDEVRQAVEAALVELAARWHPVAPAPLPSEMKLPLGVLGTDHTGYASFDLERLRLTDLAAAFGAHDEVQILAYPMLRKDSPIRVLDQNRVSPDAIVGRMTVLQADADVPLQDFALNLPAMQNAGLIDWRLSPGSFAAVPQTLLGADGCETLLPANFAVSTFHLRYVIRLNENVAGTAHPKALINEFAVSFIPIGHSLGQIQYSLPLAPGESVRLAVIDWRREDAGTRLEGTGVSESLVHEQIHDRMISETMAASLEEWQRGGSVMGGTAGGAGAAGSSGMFSGAGGAMASIGGGYATSSGSRDLTADTQQKVADSVAQATTSVRELHSSVVVQTTQEESEHIETRAFANFNRGHTMTVMYYEVLRHFRLVSQFTKQYRAVLLPRPGTHTVDTGGVVPGGLQLPGWDLEDDALLLDRQYVIRGTLLDASLSSAFDALLRVDKIRAEQKRKPPVSATPPDPGEKIFTQFHMHFSVGNETSPNELLMHVHKKDSTRETLQVGGSINLNRDEAFDDDNTSFVLVSDPLPIKWGDIDRFEIRKDSGGDLVRITKIDIIANPGGVFIHPHDGANLEMEDVGDFWPLVITPPPPQPPAPPAPTIEQLTNPDDFALIRRLKSHLNRHEDYYRRVLDLSTDPNYFARQFETTSFGAGMQIDHVAPEPLEVFGSRLAFPMIDQDDIETPVIPPTERLVSLPTRGLFADAKLGHCSVAEEIDETRFWRWDEHPLPFLASDIAAVVPIQPTTKPVDPTPTPMPSAVAVPQAPTSLPDPTGLAALLTAITTPSTFRDMSMKEELGKLLSNLIEGSVSMAQAAVQAGAVQKKLDESDRAGSETHGIARAAEAAAAASKAQTEAQKTKDQQVTPAEAQHAIKVAENQVEKGLLTKSEAKEVARTQIGNIPGSTPVKVKTRLITFMFKYDTESEMWGNYQVTILDLKTGTSYIPDGNQIDHYFYQVPLPISVKGPVLITVVGAVKSRDISAPSVIEPRPWSMTIQKNEQFASLEGVTGFNVIGQTKEANLEFTLETENQTSKTKSSSHEFGLSVKAGGTIKVVEVEGEGSYKYTTQLDETVMDGNKEVRSVKLVVRMLDRQKQPRIEAVK
jgi:hypothetical protein